MRWGFFNILTLILVFLASCVSPFNKREPILTSSDLAIYKLSAATFPGPEIQKEMPPIVPYPELTVEQFRRILALLVYSQGKDGGHAFRYEQLTPISQRLSEVIPKAGPGYRIVIVARYDPKKFFFNRVERTTLMIWADEAGINIVFGVIREEIVEGSESARDDWLGILPISLSEALENLSLDPSPYFDFKRVNGRIHNAWIILPFKKIASLPVVPPKAAETTQQVEQKIETTPQKDDLARKLAGLKQAFDQGLITKEEFEAKRKQIIDQY